MAHREEKISASASARLIWQQAEMVRCAMAVLDILQDTEDLDEKERAALETAGQHLKSAWDALRVSTDLAFKRSVRLRDE